MYKFEFYYSIELAMLETFQNFTENFSKKSKMNFLKTPIEDVLKNHARKNTLDR